MTKPVEKITLPNGREVSKFILYPKAVRDGTYRCVDCGQIDDEPYHDPTLCPGCGGALPLTDKAKAFLEANAASPVVYGSGRPEGGAYYRLTNGRTFRLSLFECRSLPAPKWDLPNE